MSTIQIHKNELAETIRSFKGKYQQIRSEFSVAGTNKRCVWGALASEMGWNGKSGTIHNHPVPDHMYDEMIAKKFPELNEWNGYTDNLQHLVTRNNKGIDWEGLAQFVERGFKD